MDIGFDLRRHPSAGGVIGYDSIIASGPCSDGSRRGDVERSDGAEPSRRRTVREGKNEPGLRAGRDARLGDDMRGGRLGAGHRHERRGRQAHRGGRRAAEATFALATTMRRVVGGRFGVDGMVRRAPFGGRRLCRGVMVCCTPIHRRRLCVGRHLWRRAVMRTRPTLGSQTAGVQEPGQDEELQKQAQPEGSDSVGGWTAHDSRKIEARCNRWQRVHLRPCGAQRMLTPASIPPWRPPCAFVPFVRP